MIKRIKIWWLSRKYLCIKTKDNYKLGDKVKVRNYFDGKLYPDSPYNKTFIIMKIIDDKTFIKTFPHCYMAEHHIIPFYG